MQQITRELLNRPIAYQPIVAKAFGSVKLAVLWCQLRYWSDKTSDEDGWIYKTKDELYFETGLSRHEQDHARAEGEKLKVLACERRGYPAKVHFLIDENMAGEIIEDYLSRHLEESKKLGIKVVNGLFGKTVAEGSARQSKPENDINFVRNLPPSVAEELAKKYRVTPRFILARAEDVVDYCEAKKKKYADYKAALRNFIKSHMDSHKPEVSQIRDDMRRDQKEKERKEEEARMRVSPEDRKKASDIIRGMKEGSGIRSHFKAPVVEAI